MKSFTARHPEGPPRKPFLRIVYPGPTVCNCHLAVHIQVMISREEWMAVSGAKERIDAALQGWSGITSQPHRFGGTEYCLRRREIGHVHGDGLVDIPFPKTVRNELVTGGRAEPPTSFPTVAGLVFI